MSLFSWFTRSSPKKKKSTAAARDPESSGLSRMEPTRPVAQRRPGAKEPVPVHNGAPANRKGERMARRELLYTVVRECMMRAGVLSASYKFKVLSLDARGRQFLIMVDLARGNAGETNGLAEIEALIAQSAKSRYDILVTAVYWRMNEHVAVGLPQARPQARPSQPMPLESSPAPLVSSPMPLPSKPAPLVSSPMPLQAAATAVHIQRPEDLAEDRTLPLRAARPAVGQRVEPLEDDEVAAFKRALSLGISGSAAVQRAQVAATATAAAATAKARSFDGANKQGPQSYTLLTGFEDTEMPEAEVRSPALSATQYGELT